MNILNVLKKIGIGGLAVADAGAKIGIPIAQQIDGIADTVKDIKGKRKVDAENIERIAEAVAGLKTVIPEIKSSPKALLESNRFKATVIGLLVSAGAYYGLPQEIATQIGEIIFYLIATYVLADTLRPSVK